MRPGVIGVSAQAVRGIHGSEWRGVACVENPEGPGLSPPNMPGESAAVLGGSLFILVWVTICPGLQLYPFLLLRMDAAEEDGAWTVTHAWGGSQQKRLGTSMCQGPQEQWPHQSVT
jgi:hypothetical protein